MKEYRLHFTGTHGAGWLYADSPNTLEFEKTRLEAVGFTVTLQERDKVVGRRYSEGWEVAR